MKSSTYVLDTANFLPTFTQMVSTQLNISELLRNIASKLKTVLPTAKNKPSLQLGQLKLNRKESTLDMLSPYIRPDVVTKYRILNNDLASIDPKEAKKIKMLVHKYYNKTIALPFSRTEIKVFSHAIAHHIKSIHAKHGKTEALKYATVIANEFGTSKPTKVSAKLFNPNYWKKSISKTVRRHEENLAIELKLFDKSYCSTAAQKRHSEELAATAAYISTLMKGDEASKKKAHAIETKTDCKKALAKAKARGLTNLKSQLGLHAIMLTFTCSTQVRKQNNAEGCSNHLTKLQNKLSSFRSNHNLSLAGSTSYEPHQYGHPHFHSYVVGSKDDLIEFIRFAEKIVQPFENSSDHTALDIKWEDNSISDLAFYVAKSTLHPSFELDVWHSSHQKRRINYFGLPADEIWNDLRKKPLSYSWGNEKLRAAQLAAKDGDYATFCLSVGGLALRRKDRPYKILYRKYLDAFNDVIKRKKGIIIFGTFLPQKHILHTVINIVKTKFPRCISLLSSALKHYDTVGLRAPPQAKGLPYNIKKYDQAAKNLAEGSLVTKETTN